MPYCESVTVTELYWSPAPSTQRYYVRIRLDDGREGWVHLSDVRIARLTTTLLVQQGVQAEMVMPDGATQPLTTLHVRATEYTVVNGGRRRCRAELPGGGIVRDTYAVELSVDEALAVGAAEVRFDCRSMSMSRTSWALAWA